MATLHMVVDPLLHLRKFITTEVVPASNIAKSVKAALARTLETSPAKEKVATTPSIKVSGIELMKVLERAAKDDNFIAQLTYYGSKALQDYNLSSEEKAALLSGDIQWIEGKSGKLDERLRRWLWCRLQQEAW